MNSKIVVPIIVGIVIVTVAVASNQGSDEMGIWDSFDGTANPDKGNTSETQGNLDKIEEIDIENDYSSGPREWITSGSFQIDRSQYILGEKIYMRVGPLGHNEKGEIVLLHQLNSTHYSVYFTLPFDGSAKSAFNYYFDPQLSKSDKFCSIDDLVGKWRVVFRGTEYPDLEFEMTDEILPGEEERYEPVC